MKALLGEDGLDRRPHNLSINCWYYEKATGLMIYIQTPERTEKVGTIRWRSIAASLRRHDAATKKRVKKPVGS